MAAQEWWYAEGGSSKGPVALPTLLGMVREGVLSGDTLVWRDGLDEWQPLSKFSPELRSASTARAPRLGEVPWGSILLAAGLAGVVLFVGWLVTRERTPVAPSEIAAPANLDAAEFAQELVDDGLLDDAEVVIEDRGSTAQATGVATIVLQTENGVLQVAGVWVGRSLEEARSIALRPDPARTYVRCRFLVVAHPTTPEESDAWSEVTAQTGSGLGEVILRRFDERDCEDPVD